MESTTTLTTPIDMAPQMDFGTYLIEVLNYMKQNQEITIVTSAAISFFAMVVAFLSCFLTFCKNRSAKKNRRIHPRPVEHQEDYNRNNNAINTIFSPNNLTGYFLVPYNPAQFFSMQQPRALAANTRASAAAPTSRQVIPMSTYAAHHNHNQNHNDRRGSDSS